MWTKHTSNSLAFRSILAGLGEPAHPTAVRLVPWDLPTFVSVLNFVLIPETEWPLKSGTRTVGKHLWKTLW